MKTKILVGTGILLATLTSCSYINQETPPQPTTAKMEEKTMPTQKMMDSKETSMEKENMAEITSDDMMKKEETAPQSTDTMKETMKQEETMVKTGTYGDYSADKLSDTQKNVLFFHASWCPACVGANKNFMNSEIPENVNLLKVDYDNSSELKLKYGVTMQHTFVLVDAKGEMIKKWSGSKDSKDLEMRASE